ncbi:hypothetical protein [Streptomyces cellostaticus]|uniref:hypothetical protein n=1 Tax=Streptomyces cellostaticus TaxID=67285 RepID=UPI001FC96310|nr:hypothetical protein [Streptomyces cellostaticus]GHI07568.1 hypothetical protein Scel_58890 [Streptomyces cellostaticus]
MADDRVRAEAAHAVVVGDRHVPFTGAERRLQTFPVATPATSRPSVRAWHAPLPLVVAAESALAATGTLSVPGAAAEMAAAVPDEPARPGRAR